MKVFVPLALLGVLLVFFVGEADAQWRGQYEVVTTRNTVRSRYCICYYWWWGCSRYRYYLRTYYSSRHQCRTGWKHNGDRNCNIPICRPSCKNGGTCENPNICNCPDTSTGIDCSSFTCSYQRPCYPGDCNNGLADSCLCEPGFLFNKTDTGCTEFDPEAEKMKPIVGKSNVTLSNIRRTDGYSDYMFILEGSSTEVDTTETIWSNQKRFNHLRFDVESYFEKIEGLPNRPLYVHESKIGIVETLIEANVSKVPRDGGRLRDPGSFKRYPCEHITQDNPEVGLASCTINDDQFRTLIEHGDWLHVAVKTKSGGVQKLLNTDQSRIHNTHYYQGLQDIKSFQFNFDFIAPKHCSEVGSWDTCTQNAVILEVAEEFTKNPIQPKWLGWTDDLSGIYEYYVEVFLLRPDEFGRLVESNPIVPLFAETIPHSNAIQYPDYRPADPGMYSVLLETRDTANNSRIARRLVLFDVTSSISLNDKADGKLYVSSAVEETGYMWQTTAESGNKVRIDVRWPNHFINHIHEDNKLLNEVLDYPIQFKDIEDSGLLNVRKYVASALDDLDGKRSKAKIPNYHGIIKFEMAKRFTLDDTEPPNGWEEIPTFEENTSFEETLDDGARVRVWIRATDVMGNTRTDSTLMRVDGTGPVMSQQEQQGHEFNRNIDQGLYNYSSSMNFVAKDDQSGVFKIGIKLSVRTPEKTDRVLYEGNETAMVFDTFDNAACDDIEGKCFIPNQNVQIDNCWFLISKEDLDNSTGIIEVTAYNQALLTTTRIFDIGKISSLKGLEKYDGPRNFRIESLSDKGFRLSWDIPEEESCYGRATVVITLLAEDKEGKPVLRTVYTSGTSRFYDFYGLEPKTAYGLNVGLQSSSEMIGKDVELAVTTNEEVITKTPVGLIVGVALGVLTIVAIVIIIFAVLVRRGVLSPPREQARRIRNTVRRRARTIYGGLHNEGGQSSSSKSDYTYDNRQSELYIYGGMDLSAAHAWDIERNDVTFETLIKSGHFANIYKARLRKQNGSTEVVVAKTLKENYTADNEFLMKAKINFTGQQVGNHPNVLKFVGAVTSDDAMGPFILYEYCEHGTLKEYLVDNKSNLTIELQENLFRFGLDVAKGMEYLAGKGIVHRRLAARNILLTFVNEVKISGFGPQPHKDEDGDAEQGKKERIPIKWMAPECMGSTKDATEKSDVWSYAVVLWEIFSMGETPYTGKGQDLPQRLKKGERLARPEQCDEVWYNVMKKCWEYKPEKRPTFSKVRDELDNLFVAAPGDDYYFYKR